MHAVIKDYFSIYIATDPSTWDDYIHSATYAYNTAVHTSTGFTPFELLYGRKPRLPYLTDAAPEDYYKNTVADFQCKLQHLWLEARKNTAKTHQNTKERYDQNAHEIEFEVGQEALLKIPRAKCQLQQKVAFYEGPYKITAVNAPNVTLKIGHNDKTVHANRLRLYHKRSSEGDENVSTEGSQQSPQ
jgi:hypothetical protein